MAARTEAQEEFDNIFSKNQSRVDRHPEDARDRDESYELDEETKYRQDQVEENMRMPFSDRIGGTGKTNAINLPHPSFDSGRTTGVKGVIADARSYEQSKKEGRRGTKYETTSGRGDGRINGNTVATYQQNGRGGQSFLDDEIEGEDEDEEFLERWRESRRMEIQREGSDIRNRRTSPSVRRYGRFDEVDALGYLDAIEKVGRETIVVVFVYDHESEVSEVIEQALAPLVPVNPAVHFVKVHYDDIEFDNAGVPAILAYKNQGDLFANLTYVIDHIPEDVIFDTQALKDVLRKKNVL